MKNRKQSGMTMLGFLITLSVVMFFIYCGMKIVPIVEDPASDPATFAEKARKLVVGDKCVSVFGSYTSASRKACS